MRQRRAFCDRRRGERERSSCCHDRLRHHRLAAHPSRLRSDGSCTLANAGHLPPYRNGLEFDPGSGLPLGITLNTTFEERQFQLVPGDPSPSLYDGVVEARNAQGELFGFDRTQKISTQSAHAIADAAKAFGQEDEHHGAN